MQTLFGQDKRYIFLKHNVYYIKIKSRKKKTYVYTFDFFIDLPESIFTYKFEQIIFFISLYTRSYGT